jgi:hypothetical protein
MVLSLFSLQLKPIEAAIVRAEMRRHGTVAYLVVLRDLRRIRAVF